MPSSRKIAGDVLMLLDGAWSAGCWPTASAAAAADDDNDDDASCCCVFLCHPSVGTGSAACGAYRHSAPQYWSPLAPLCVGHLVTSWTALDAIICLQVLLIDTQHEQCAVSAAGAPVKFGIRTTATAATSAAGAAAAAPGSMPDSTALLQQLLAGAAMPWLLAWRRQLPPAHHRHMLVGGRCGTRHRFPTMCHAGRMRNAVRINSQHSTAPVQRHGRTMPPGTRLCCRGG
jgi:hypothetical protein